MANMIKMFSVHSIFICFLIGSISFNVINSSVNIEKSFKNFSTTETKKECCQKGEEQSESNNSEEIEEDLDDDIFLFTQSQSRPSSTNLSCHFIYLESPLLQAYVNDIFIPPDFFV